MSTCDKCGEEIEFKYIDGRPIPIHSHGSGCSGYSASSSDTAAQQFRSDDSYVNPNAHCPVCGKVVFFYQSQHGGRVFFDDLGWPWPKHPCTDNPASQTNPVRWHSGYSQGMFKNGKGEWLEIYELDDIFQGEDGEIGLSLKKPGSHRYFSAKVATSYLHGRDIVLDDIRAAPSLVIRTYDTYRRIQFISVRHERIVSFRVERARKAETKQ